MLFRSSVDAAIRAARIARSDLRSDHLPSEQGLERVEGAGAYKVSVKISKTAAGPSGVQGNVVLRVEQFAQEDDQGNLTTANAGEVCAAGGPVAELVIDIKEDPVTPVTVRSVLRVTG